MSIHLIHVVHFQRISVDNNYRNIFYSNSGGARKLFAFEFFNQLCFILLNRIASSQLLFQDFRFITYVGLFFGKSYDRKITSDLKEGRGV